MIHRFVRLAPNLMRYSLAMIGPVGSALAQFVLSLVLLHRLNAAAFGSFAFLLISAQLGLGVWTALLCAPLPMLLARADEPTRERLMRTLLILNLLGASVAFIVFVAAGLLLGLAPRSAALFAGFAAVALLRWFARAHAYATGAPLRTMSSDLVYCTVLFGGISLIVLSGAEALVSACGALAAASAVALLPFGRSFLARQFVRLSLRSVGEYGVVWRLHSRWSLIGVVTTEITANAHAYLVTLLLGPSAFAALAASALMIRPINVTAGALAEFERSQIARQIGIGRLDLAFASTRFFRAVIMGAWAATALTAVLLLRVAPHLIFPARYDLGFLVTGTALWMATAAIRSLRTPDNVLLQAAGSFQQLAWASIWSSGVSVGAVLTLLLLGGPLLSILGVLTGEAVFAATTWHQVRVWRSGAAAAARPELVLAMPLTPID